MCEPIKAKERKDVYLAISKNDNPGTVVAVADLQITAIRVSRGAVKFEKVSAIKIDGIWFVPVPIEPPNEKDIQKKEEDDEVHRVLQKALEAGFTDSEIKALQKYNFYS